MLDNPETYEHNDLYTYPGPPAGVSDHGGGLHSGLLRVVGALGFRVAFVGRLRVVLGRLRVVLGRLRVVVGRLRVVVGRLRVAIVVALDGRGLALSPSRRLNGCFFANTILLPRDECCC